MKVHLIKAKTVRNFADKHAVSVASFDAWIDQLKMEDWETPNDILSVFSSADILGQGSKRVVFNIGGNNYRIICSYRFGRHVVRLYVNWIGTHAEYDKLCKNGKQYMVADY